LSRIRVNLGCIMKRSPHTGREGYEAGIVCSEPHSEGLNPLYKGSLLNVDVAR
jgi:hypothetical protein